MNKNIIIAILIVIIVAAGVALMFNGKTNTQINILSNETFQNGEQIQFELKDTQNNPVSGQNLSITFNKNETYSVITDSNGKGYLTISGESAGKYEIEVKYNGNDKYNGCSAKETITITDDAPDNAGSQTSDSVASTNQYNNNPVSDNSGQNLNKSPDNPFPGDPGTYFVGQYELWVRSSDQVVIDSPNGNGIGLTLNQWLAKYGPDNPDYQ